MQRRDEREPDTQQPKFESGALWSERKERKASPKSDRYELGIQKLRVKSRAYRGEWDEQHKLHEERISSKGVCISHEQAVNYTRSFNQPSILRSDSIQNNQFNFIWSN